MGQLHFSWQLIMAAIQGSMIRKCALIFIKLRACEAVAQQPLDGADVLPYTPHSDGGGYDTSKPSTMRLNGLPTGTHGSLEAFLGSNE